MKQESFPWAAHYSSDNCREKTDMPAKIALLATSVIKEYFQNLNKSSFLPSVLKPFGQKGKAAEEEDFPLPPPVDADGNLGDDLEDDNVTLVGDESPPWRPSPPPSPPPVASVQKVCSLCDLEKLLSLSTNCLP